MAFFGALVERKKTEVSSNLPSWIKAVFGATCNEGSFLGSILDEMKWDQIKSN